MTLSGRIQVELALRALELSFEDYADIKRLLQKALDDHAEVTTGEDQEDLKIHLQDSDDDVRWGIVEGLSILSVDLNLVAPEDRAAAESLLEILWVEE